MSNIEIADYNPAWALAFNKLKLYYEVLLHGLFTDIQHVGSTAVEGLAAKPVIDIDIIIENQQLLAPVTGKLVLAGYQHLGNLGITGREAFKYTHAPHLQAWPRHNLYVCLAGSISLKNHLAFRNYLRSQPESAQQYGKLKKQLALVCNGNIDKYVEGKTAFIVNVLQKCGFKTSELRHITQANKTKH